MSVKEFGRILHERERNELDGWYIWKGLEASYMGISLEKGMGCRKGKVGVVEFV